MPKVITTWSDNYHSLEARYNRDITSSAKTSSFLATLLSKRPLILANAWRTRWFGGIEWLDARWFDRWREVLFATCFKVRVEGCNVCRNSCFKVTVRGDFWNGGIWNRYTPPDWSLDRNYICVSQTCKYQSALNFFLREASIHVFVYYFSVGILVSRRTWTCS